VTGLPGAKFHAGDLRQRTLCAAGEQAVDFR